MKIRAATLSTECRGKCSIAGLMMDRLPTEPTLCYWPAAYAAQLARAPR